jgi:hypothetical protein
MVGGSGLPPWVATWWHCPPDPIRLSRLLGFACRAAEEPRAEGMSSKTGLLPGNGPPRPAVGQADSVTCNHVIA